MIAPTTLDEIIKEQYYLAKAGISILESNLLPDFERDAFMSMIIKEAKEELEAMKRAGNHA